MQINFRKILVLVLLLKLVSYSKAHAETIVVTHASNQESLDLKDVKSIFQGITTRWLSGERVILVLPEFESPRGQVVLEKIYGFTQDKYIRYWLDRLYRHDSIMLPILKKNPQIKEFLQLHPQAISVIDLSELDPTLRRVLALD